ncbi:hypothetical protein VNO77_07574 [Canavalia gladiata]|uniref:Uncharacterized protein n=1 Tax=Canavalia gladiata TaxID=3824 RepID=A0AAN9QW79_CANGL
MKSYGRIQFVHLQIEDQDFFTHHRVGVVTHMVNGRQNGDVIYSWPRRLGISVILLNIQPKEVNNKD